MCLLQSRDKLVLPPCDLPAEEDCQRCSEEHEAGFLFGDLNISSLEELDNSPSPPPTTGGVHTTSTAYTCTLTTATSTTAVLTTAALHSPLDKQDQLGDTMSSTPRAFTEQSVGSETVSRQVDACTSSTNGPNVAINDADGE